VILTTENKDNLMQ